MEHRHCLIPQVGSMVSLVLMAIKQQKGHDRLQEGTTLPPPSSETPDGPHYQEASHRLSSMSWTLLTKLHGKQIYIRCLARHWQHQD
jgi:hypothetical protein